MNQLILENGFIGFFVKFFVGKVGKILSAAFAIQSIFLRQKWTFKQAKSSRRNPLFQNQMTISCLVAAKCRKV